MRKLEFHELNIKETLDENSFYQYYLKNLPKPLNQTKIFKLPEKNYEIFYLDILGGKIILLNKKYLPNSDENTKDLFYDYETAYKIYNYLVDIYEGIDKEHFEFNELYKNERLDKNSKVNKLKLMDDELFRSATNEYNIIKNSQLYTDYLKLVEENKKLQQTNTELIQENKKVNELYKKQIKELSTNNISFLQKIINKFKKEKLLNNGENK